MQGDLKGLEHDVASLKQLLRSAKAVQHGLATVDVEFDDQEMRASPRPGAVASQQRVRWAALKPVR